MKTIAGLFLTTVLTMSAGCAKTDWIDRTLVTVDVTGTWQSPNGWELDLVQEGQKVTGSIRRYLPLELSIPPFSGPIEGTVAGDIFTFRQANGPVTGETRVGGDEMSGTLNWRTTQALTLRRVSSPTPPAAPRR